MEDETGNDIVPQKRRKNSEDFQEVDAKAKKARLFAIKDFRKLLNSNENLNGLKEFLSAINYSTGHDYMCDYLKNGGNCLELLQTLERNSAIPPTLVFDLVTQLILKINASYRQFYSSAHESCRYLINNYLPLVHKMLGLSSSKEERKACLKLLTAMAAFSPNIAKDILVNVKFHSVNIELLTKHTGEVNGVRDCFVRFLTAFLVESDLHTLSILLEKSSLLTGIISGLQYDAADTVCIVVTAMKNHILENNAVMKTSKMHVFNTAVVKDIVNLYNWKGPEGLKTLDKNNRTVFEVDKVAKSKVSECVHDFLLVLCTSHKHGVIFRDPTVGLGKKNQNSLMYTVLDSLDRPWEHSYASELVIKICRSCPDLTKNLWSILKPFLQPRFTEKWLITMNFARKLIKEMEPPCIEYCARDLNAQQLAQIVEFLVSPSPILKIILHDENDTTNDPEIKRHISVLLCDMLEKVDSYAHFVKKWTSVEVYTRVKQYLSNYISRNYPNAQKLLEDWKRLYLEESTVDIKNKSDTNKHTYLETVLNIADLYKSIAPQLLHSLTSTSLDLKELLLKLASQPDEDLDKLETLQMKIISIYVDIDHSYFLPRTEIFSYVMRLLLKMYHRTKNEKIQMVLHKILKNTGLFGGSLYEINIWLNGIFNFNVFTLDFGDDFVQIIKNTFENILGYQKELSEINIEEGEHEKDDGFIEILLDMSEESENSARKIRHRHLSPLICGFLKHLQLSHSSKNTKKYFEFVLLNLFHYQTVSSKFFFVMQNYREQVPGNVFNYIQNWVRGYGEPLTNVKGALEGFKALSETFLDDDVNELSLVDVCWYPDFLINILQMCTFYFSRLIDRERVSQKHSKNWIILIDLLCKRDIIDDRCLEIILENPILIKNFKVIQFGKATSSGICTEALITILEKLNESNIGNIENYASVYSSCVFRSLVKILKKPKKHSSSQSMRKTLEVCPLGYDDCTKVILQISGLLNNASDVTDNVLDILTYCLDRVLFLYEQNSGLKPLDEFLISTITSHLTRLNSENKENHGLSRTLKNYLESFPHYLSHIDSKLFSSILQLGEYNNDNADFAVFLLGKNLNFAKEIEANITNVAEKKGLILPLVHVLVDFEGCDDILKIIYDKLDASVMKALQKPQKVGQHFLKNYNIAPLIDKFMPLEKCMTLADKAHKFEVTELFHVKLLEACYSKILNEGELNDKQTCGVILTFVHLEMALFKRKLNLDEDIVVKVNEVSHVFNGLMEKLASKEANRNLSQLANNETFKSFCKFALKYGISGQNILLKLLRNLVELLRDALGKDEANLQANLLLEMLSSHSEFLNVILGEYSDTKLEVLRLFLTICRNWNEVMEKSHVAVILSAYRGLVTRCDRTVLAILKLYESKAEQTRFYDFKPFLWGRAAATHYSVRTQVGNSLFRQPKINDVLGIIKEDLVNWTITNHPLNESLNQEDQIPVEDLQCYDLKFLLPLFSHILAPEQQVKTYVFSRSGALSLTIVGLSSQDKEVRQAACHVLSRFHFHLEARQTGKDNLLWIRFIEALCKGAAVIPDFKLNNFASIFYARMGLILTNPKHLMYTPLSSYLTAKEDLDLSTVPELYTLLFSSDVNFKEHRNFILEILRDGLRTERDFVDFLKSMGFKLFSELFSSCLSDTDSKLLILDILLAACRLPLGVKILCENYSVLAQLYTLTSNVLTETKSSASILPKIFGIFLEILKVRPDSFSNRLIFDIFVDVLRSDSFSHLQDGDIRRFYEVCYTIHTINSEVFKNQDAILNFMLDMANDKFCNYVRNFGCKFLNETSLSLQVKDKNYFLRLLVFKIYS